MQSSIITFNFLSVDKDTGKIKVLDTDCLKSADILGENDSSSINSWPLISIYKLLVVFFILFDDMIPNVWLSAIKIDNLYGNKDLPFVFLHNNQ